MDKKLEVTLEDIGEEMNRLLYLKGSSMDEHILLALVEKARTLGGDTAVTRLAAYNGKASRKNLHTCVWFNKIRTTEAFLDAGSDIEMRDLYDDTILLNSIKCTHPDMTQMLVSRGADLNAIDRYGFSALHRASGWGQHEIAYLLARCGASINAMSGGGKTPIRFAVEIRDKKGFDILCKWGVGLPSVESLSKMRPLFRYSPDFVAHVAKKNAERARTVRPLEQLCLEVLARHPDAKQIIWELPHVLRPGLGRLLLP